MGAGRTRLSSSQDGLKDVPSSSFHNSRSSQLRACGMLSSGVTLVGVTKETGWGKGKGRAELKGVLCVSCPEWSASRTGSCENIPDHHPWNPSVYITWA